MRRAAALGGLALALAACITHRGPWRDGAAPAPDRDAITLVALGGAGFGGRKAQDSADALARVLAESRRHGKPATVLWLGDAVGPNPLGKPICPDRDDRWTRRGIQELASVVRDHVAAGGTSLGVPGAAEWQCDALGDRTPPITWTAPALVRIDDVGRPHVASSCEHGRCSVEPAATPAKVELVLLDLWPWLGPKDVRNADSEVARTTALLQALPRGEGTPPRVLVLYLPVEAALARGRGGRGRPLATFHLLPPAVQSAVSAGDFVGVIAGGEHGQYTVLDVGWGIRRTERVWLKTPVWQVVSGGVADANARPGAAFRRSWYAHSIGYEPNVRTDHAGFTVVRITGDGAEAVLGAEVRGRWEHARIALPLSVEPHAVQGPAPVMTPCLLCPSVPANDRP